MKNRSQKGNLVQRRMVVWLTLQDAQNGGGETQPKNEPARRLLEENNDKAVTNRQTIKGRQEEVGSKRRSKRCKGGISSVGRRRSAATLRKGNIVEREKKGQGTQDNEGALRNTL